MHQIIFAWLYKVELLSCLVQLYPDNCSVATDQLFDQFKPLTVTVLELTFPLFLLYPGTQLQKEIAVTTVKTVYGVFS